jgi:HK97 family phage prohead protease
MMAVTHQLMTRMTIRQLTQKMRNDMFERKDAGAMESSMFTPIELKEVGNDNGDMIFSGYGSVFGNKDHHGDVIAKGAFRETLRDAKKSGNWPAMLLQHGSFLGGDDNMPVGVWTTLKEDDTGLYVEGKLAPTQRGKDAYELLKMTPRPAINGMSIGFVSKKWELGTKPDQPRRTIKAVELLEVSLVTTPANPLARVQNVKAADDIQSVRDFEKFLRDVGGFSNSQAKYIASRGFKADDLRDEDEAAKVVEQLRHNISKLSQ